YGDCAATLTSVKTTDTLHAGVEMLSSGGATIAHHASIYDSDVIHHHAGPLTASDLNFTHGGILVQPQGDLPLGPLAIDGGTIPGFLQLVDAPVAMLFKDVQIGGGGISATFGQDEGVPSVTFDNVKVTGNGVVLRGEYGTVTGLGMTVTGHSQGLG